jgi:hypothetical protein
MLHLLEGGDPTTVAASSPQPFDLSAQWTRPGVAHEPLAARLDGALAHAVSEAASGDGVDIAAWVVLTVESERSLDALALAPRERDLLTRFLDEEAAQPAPGFIGGAARLRAYAAALRRLRSAPLPQSLSRQLILAVPYHSASAWARSAAAANCSPQEWVATVVARLPRRRHLWEAVAAEQGSTLGEWIALQAAWRLRATV